MESKQINWYFLTLEDGEEVRVDRNDLENYSCTCYHGSFVRWQKDAIRYREKCWHYFEARRRIKIGDDISE